MEKVLETALIFNNVTTDEWASSKKVLRNGELAIEKSPNHLTFKLGDGVNKWANLRTLSNNPSLSTSQKTTLKNLMTDYLNQKSLFVYDGSFRRESYAYPSSVSSLSGSIDGCKYNGQYILNCGLFAQMIWMGRKITDFTSTPSTKINTAFDWGYYFDFTSCRRAYGVMKNSTTYYTGNTYLNASGDRAFISFDNAAAMAQELYLKGYEIPYSEVDIGDMVFYRSDHISDGDTDGLEQSSFRYITHVGLVYNLTENGPTIAECTNAFSSALGKSGLGNDVTKFGNVRAAGQEQRVVMAARHPVAWGHKGNVPTNFTTYRGADVQ